MNKYRVKHIVKSYETDAFSRLSLANICYLFQEAANMHASAMDWGIEYLNSINKFWVLSRLKIKIRKYPVHKDEIEITTWSRGAEGFFAYRDYQVKLNGESCIDAVSSWMILDRHSHRPCKIDQIGKAVTGIDENYLHFPETKFASLEKKNLLFEKKVSFSDIDINLHVNNGKYVEILTDALSALLMNLREIREIDIQFLAESQYGDILQVFTVSPDLINASDCYLSIENRSKGKEAISVWVISVCV